MIRDIGHAYETTCTRGKQLHMRKSGLNNMGVLKQIQLPDALVLFVKNII